MERFEKEIMGVSVYCIPLFILKTVRLYIAFHYLLSLYNIFKNPVGILVTDY